MYRIIEPRRDLKATAALGVDKGGEHRGRVERREAKEVDCPILSHERHRVKVADDAVVFYGRVAARLHTRHPDFRIFPKTGVRAGRHSTPHSAGLHCEPIRWTGAAMFKLYDFRSSHYSEKARWALDFKGIPYAPRHLLPGFHMRTTRKLAPRS